jgi:predicted dithiol-disulfide oxidoreductase (DUF899 family)
MQQHKIASREEWLEARKELLGKEKALTRLHDHLAAERRKLPWVNVEKPYLFDTETGKATLADLFEGRSQLIIRHFMFGPGWKGRWVSSHGSDFNHDFHVAFRKEDGPMFYNYREVEFMGEDQPGVSVFVKDEAGQVFHTYSTFSRGDEGAVSSYFYLDLTPKGRREDGPRNNLMDWVKRHDEYGAPAQSGCCAAE